MTDPQNPSVLSTKCVPIEGGYRVDLCLGGEVLASHADPRQGEKPLKMRAAINTASAMLTAAQAARSKYSRV